MKRRNLNLKEQDQLQRFLIENKKIKSENRSLRKELRKALEYIDSIKDVLEDEVAGIEVVPVKETEECPKCQGSVTEIPAGKFVVLKCKQCTWRRRV